MKRRELSVCMRNQGDVDALECDWIRLGYRVNHEGPAYAVRVPHGNTHHVRFTLTGEER